MIRKFIALTISVLAVTVSTYAQDSLRTKNDKPGTPQSLRTYDNTPQSNVNIVNKPGTANGTSAPEGNKIDNTNSQINTTGTNPGKPSTNPITIVNNPPAHVDSTTNHSAIQNGISNTTNPIRNQ